MTYVQQPITPASGPLAAPRTFTPNMEGGASGHPSVPGSSPTPDIIGQQATGWFPSDTSIAVSGSYVVETVNDQITQFANPAGNRIYAVTLENLISQTGERLATGEYCTDSTIAYWYWDNRFAVNCTIARQGHNETNNRLETFVSLGGDPSSNGWCRYEYTTVGNRFLDAPSITVSADKIAIAGQGDALGGSQLVVWDKAAMLSCSYAVFSEFGFSDGLFRAAVHQVNENDPKFISCCPGGNLKDINIIGTTGQHNVSATEYTIEAKNSAPFNDVTLPGGNLGDGYLNNSIRTAVQSYETDGNGYTMEISSNGACGSLVGAELLKLNTNVQPPTVINDWVVCGANNWDLYYPATALDSYGDVYFTVSASQSLLSMPEANFYADTPNFQGLWAYVLQSPASGTTPCGNGTCNERWGDYLGAAQDQGNGNYVWGAPDYQAANGETGWGTVFARGNSGGCC